MLSEKQNIVPNISDSTITCVSDDGNLGERVIYSSSTIDNFLEKLNSNLNYVSNDILKFKSETRNNIYEIKLELRDFSTSDKREILSKLEAHECDANDTMKKIQSSIVDLINLINSVQIRVVRVETKVIFWSTLFGMVGSSIIGLLIYLAKTNFTTLMPLLDKIK